MPYTHTKLSDAVTLLAAWLNDALLVRWVSDELQTNIIEALRTFSALTGIYEVESDPVTIPANTTFIDLPTTFAALCGYTVRDQDIIGQCQYALLEPKSVSLWTGTEMFTLDLVVKAIQRTRDRFLLETGCRLTRSTPATVITPDASTYPMVDTVTDVKRVAWVTPSGRISRLWAESAFSTRAANPTWSLTPGLPLTYQVITRAPLELQFSPVPQSAGTLDLLTVDAGATLDPVAGVLLGVPDDFVPAIKWGALADLLTSDGPARDYARALFCERRYRVLVAAAMAYRSISDGRVNGRTMQIDSIDALDMARPLWQSKTGAVPTTVAMAGMNMLAVERPPRADCQMQLTLRRKAIVPVAPGDYIQIGREYLDTILGYALHICMFKIGGQELAATTQLADAFFQTAVEFNSRLTDSSAFEEAAYGTSDQQSKQQDRGVRRVTGATVSSA